MPSLKLPNLFRRAADQQSLKERAASLRASVGALINSEASSDADPISSDAELLALAPVWEAAVNLEKQRIAEENTAAEAPCNVGWPGPAPADSGPRYEAWRQQLERWRLRSGMAAAEEATSAAGRAVHETELRIASMPAATLAGMRLKARVAKRSDDLGVVWPNRLGEGLARDVLALSDIALDFGADRHIAELAAKFCTVYREHAEADRAMMAGEISEAEWKGPHDAIVALAKELAAAAPTTLAGLALKCLGPVGLQAWQIGTNDDPAGFDPQERIAAEVQAAILDGTHAPIVSGASSQSRLSPTRQ